MQSAGGGHARAEIHQLPNPKCAGAFMGHSTRRPVREWQKKLHWQQRMKFLKAKHKIGRLIPSFCPRIQKVRRFFASKILTRKTVVYV